MTHRQRITLVGKDEIFAGELYMDLEAMLEPFFIRLQQLERNIMSALTDLQTAVTNEDTVIASAVTLIQGIPALITAAGTDPAALAKLTSDINAQAQSLAAAVTANTPAANPPAAGTAAS